MVFSKGVSFKITYPRSSFRIILDSLTTFKFLKKRIPSIFISCYPPLVLWGNQRF